MAWNKRGGRENVYSKAIGKSFQKDHRVRGKRGKLWMWFWRSVVCGYRVPAHMLDIPAVLGPGIFLFVRSHSGGAPCYDQEREGKENGNKWRPGWKWNWVHSSPPPPPSKITLSGPEILYFPQRIDFSASQFTASPFAEWHELLWGFFSSKDHCRHWKQEKILFLISSSGPPGARARAPG